MDTKIDKKLIIASSSGWVSSLLNLFPGIGVGYIYQRRWRPYFLTIGTVIIWFISGILLQKNNIPTETEQIIGLSGLALISLITSIESNLAHKKSFEAITEISSESNNQAVKKGWFSK
tara:strand:+ start:83 stop:436 length:354 start_codon:yes stop_codon:yes gene_type:complete